METTLEQPKKSFIKIFIVLLLLAALGGGAYAYAYMYPENAHMVIDKVSNLIKNEKTKLLSDKSIQTNKQTDDTQEADRQNITSETKTTDINVANQDAVDLTQNTETTNDVIAKEQETTQIDSIDTSSPISLANDIKIEKGVIGTSLLQENNDQYNALVERLMPSVVYIRGVAMADTEIQGRLNLIASFNGEILPPKKTKVLVGGSGFFISKDGYIVTNHHVIDDTQDIDVETHNGKKYKAKVVGYDEGADLAVLKINPNKNETFISVPFGNSDDVSVGDRVVVIGGPLGYKWSVSSGIVSAKSRDGYKVNSVGEFIQIDAAVNHGNSGGPAFNMKGEVIGINTWGYEATQGMNFSIASKTALDVVPKIQKGKNISRGLLGVSVAELEPWDVKAVDMQTNTGVLVHSVVKFGPADKAGIKRGDIILKVNNQIIKDQNSLIRANRNVMSGDVSELEINRYGKILKFKVKTIDKKELEKLDKGEIGLQELNTKTMTLELLTSRKHFEYKFPADVKGVYISSIKNNTDPLFMLAVGDVIMQINDTAIQTIEDYQQAIELLKKNRKDMAMFHIYSPSKQSIKVIGSKFE